MTYWDYEEAVAALPEDVAVPGRLQRAAKAGLEDGDTVHIGNFELEWTD